MIITPFRFAIVEEGLYRGGYPTPKNFRFLKRLSLKTIVSLIPDPPNEPLVEFCEAQNINHIHFSIPKFKEEDSKVTIPSHTVAEVIHITISRENHPLFIHCLDGTHTTGVVVMALRRLQNWSLSIIFSEFARFTRDASISSTESEFIENFNQEILVPVSIPMWLWQGIRLKELHPTLPIKLAPEVDPKPELRKREVKRTVHAQWKDPTESENAIMNGIGRTIKALDLHGV